VYEYSCTPSLTSALDGGGLSTPRSSHFTPGKDTRYPLHRNKCGVPGPVGTLVKNLAPLPPPGFDSRIIQLVENANRGRSISGVVVLKETLRLGSTEAQYGSLQY